MANANPTEPPSGTPDTPDDDTLTRCPMGDNCEFAEAWGHDLLLASEDGGLRGAFAWLDTMIQDYGIDPKDDAVRFVTVHNWRDPYTVTYFAEEVERHAKHQRGPERVLEAEHHARLRDRASASREATTHHEQEGPDLARVPEDVQRQVDATLVKAREAFATIDEAYRLRRHLGALYNSDTYPTLGEPGNPGALDGDLMVACGLEEVDALLGAIELRAAAAQDGCEPAVDRLHHYGLTGPGIDDYRTEAERFAEYLADIVRARRARGLEGLFDDAETRRVWAPEGQVWQDGTGEYPGCWMPVEEAGGNHRPYHDDGKDLWVVPVPADEPARQADLMQLAASVRDLSESVVRQSTRLQGAAALLDMRRRSDER